MPTTRRQAAIAEGKISPAKDTRKAKKESTVQNHTEQSKDSQKRNRARVEEEKMTQEAPKKKAKVDSSNQQKADMYHAGGSIRLF